MHLDMTNYRENRAQPTIFHRTHQQLRWLFAGAAAGFAVDLTLYPLDTIKTRMQSKHGFLASGGFRQIYRGIPAVILSSAPGSAVFFLTYSNCKDLIQSRHGRGTSEKIHVSAPINDAFCATFGEIAACVIRVPTEIVKQRAQTAQQSLSKIILEIYSHSGRFTGFYRGYMTTICREIPFSFIEFPLWEWLKRQWMLHEVKDSCTPIQSAACGSLAGLTAAAVTTPLDVLKTRVMLDRSKQTKSLFPLALNILSNEGILRLYSGVLPRSLWMSFGGFIFFFSYEFALRATERII